jgi:Mn2+/Fe2+ NRAMP family transporter
MKDPKTSSNKFVRFWKILGPGLVTGASDDDPSGIATYSQAGTAFGLSTLWTALITFPLMASIQEMCARIGLVTSHGLAGTLKTYYSKPVLIAIILHISNNKKIMDKNTNGKWSNIPGVAAFVLMSAAAVVLVYMQLSEMWE